MPSEPFIRLAASVPQKLSFLLTIHYDKNKELCVKTRTYSTPFHEIILATSFMSPTPVIIV